MTLDDGYPSEDLPLDKLLTDGRPVADHLEIALLAAETGADLLDQARREGKRRDLLAAERNLEAAMTAIRTVRYAL